MPPSCSPQAWAAAAPLALLQSCLGLRFDPAAGEVCFDQPVLPDFLDEVVLRRLAIGEGSLDVALRRARHEVVVTVLARSGDVRVVTRA
jgi:glycogen debranching enzyme